MVRPSLRFPWAVRLAILFGVIALFFFLRSYYAFVLPDLACEDGSLMFAYYTNHPQPVQILRTYMGYLSLLPNGLGYLATQLPPPAVPYAMAYTALLIKVTAFTLFAGRRFRPVLASDSIRWLIALALAVAPLGDRLLNDNLTYSIWNLLLLLVLLVAAPWGGSQLGRALQFLVMVFAAVSIPVAVVIVPICLYNFITQPADRWRNGGLIGVILLYLWLGVEWTGEEPRSLLAALWYTPIYLLNRVVAEAVMGYHLRLWLQTHGLVWVIYAFAALISLGLGVSSWFQRRYLSMAEQRWLGITLYVILAITGFSVYARNMDGDSHLGAWNHRYFYVQQYLFLLIGAVVVARTWPSIPYSKLRIGVGLALAGYLLFLHMTNTAYFRAYAELGQTTAIFLQSIYTYQQQGEAAEPREFVLKRDCFDLHVTVDGRAGGVK